MKIREDLIGVVTVVNSETGVMTVLKAGDEVSEGVTVGGHVLSDEGESGEAVEKPLAKMTKAELGVVAEAEGVDISSITTKPGVVAAIESARAAQVPATAPAAPLDEGDASGDESAAAPDENA